jgi:hypothetical protein
LAHQDVGLASFWRETLLLRLWRFFLAFAKNICPKLQINNVMAIFLLVRVLTVRLHSIMLRLLLVFASRLLLSVEIGSGF